MHWESVKFSVPNASHTYAAQKEIWWYNANRTTTKVVVQLLQYHEVVNYFGSTVSDVVVATCKRGV